MSSRKWIEVPGFGKVSPSMHRKIVDQFSERGWHYSASGKTCVLIVSWCIENGRRCEVQKVKEGGFIVSKPLTERALDVLRKEPGLYFTARQIATALGDVSSRSVAVGLNFAVRHKVEVLSCGHGPYRYRIGP